MRLVQSAQPMQRPKALGSRAATGQSPSVSSVSEWQTVQQTPQAAAVATHTKPKEVCDATV